jgi:hypothetical protein
MSTEKPQYEDMERTDILKTPKLTIMTTYMKEYTTAPSVDLDLPRLSLELEFLISGYGCFGDGRGTHFGVKE